MTAATRSTATQQPSALEFPCAFPIKIMGRTQDGFAQAIVDVVPAARAGLRRRDARDARVAAQGNCLSVTATVNATSREQLDDLYRELVAHPMVTMVL